MDVCLVTEDPWERVVDDLSTWYVTSPRPFSSVLGREGYRGVRVGCRLPTGYLHNVVVTTLYDPRT